MADTDSLPRIKLEDLFLTIREFEKEPTTTLERLRCRICVNRKHKLGGDLATGPRQETTRLNFNAFPSWRQGLFRRIKKRMK